MNIRRLLNVSTHPGEPELFSDTPDNVWAEAERFLERWEFDGFELYPVGDYPCEQIPARIITGLHLRFFVILSPIWRNDRKQLMEIFGDWETVSHFYGGRDAEWIAKFYAHQLDLARHLGCAYVVFHPVDCDLAHIFDWQFPWHLNDTLDLCAEVINAATRQSDYEGLILFENLWWPGGFLLDDPREYDYLLSRVEHPNCGITLDTGHLMNKNPHLTNECEAAEYLLRCVENLGETAKHIRTVHLTKSLSGDYIRKSRSFANPFGDACTFWEKFDITRKHAGNIDQHLPFDEPHVAAVLEKIEPDHVVFEFTFRNMAQWEAKIAAQKAALLDCLWPGR